MDIDFRVLFQTLTYSQWFQYLVGGRVWSLGSIKGFSNAWFTDEETESQVSSVPRVTVSEGRAQIVIMKRE